MENPGDQLIMNMTSMTLSSGDLKAGPDVNHQVQPTGSLTVGGAVQEPTAPDPWPSLAPLGYLDDISSDEWDDDAGMEDEDDFEFLLEDERYEEYLLAANNGFPTGTAAAELSTNAAQVAAVLNPITLGNLTSLPTYNDSIEGTAGGADVGTAEQAAAVIRPPKSKATQLAALSLGLGAQAQAQMLRFRDKFGTAAWNEYDAEELNRVYRNGPTYNNHHNWVEAKNLLNLYKSARAVSLPAATQEGQGQKAAGGTAETEAHNNNYK